MSEYAPAAYRALNGIFCVYKPTGRSMYQVIHTLQTNLSRELNQMPCRPARERVIIHEENLDTNLPTVTSVPDLADHPLAVGPRYITEDFHIRCAGALDKHSSGVQVLSIGRGHSLLRSIVSARHNRVYHVKGQLGMATQDFSSIGKIIQRTTYHHVTQARIDRVVAAMQAGHQKHMFLAAGVDLQSQEAYDLAVQGMLRPTDNNAGPVVYGMKCIQFDPPNFTLEVHTVNEVTSYLRKIIHEIGLEARSTAVCTHVRRIRYGHFQLQHALLMKHCNVQGIAENIQLCRTLVTEDRLRMRKLIESSSGDNERLLLNGNNNTLRLTM